MCRPVWPKIYDTLLLSSYRDYNIVLSKTTSSQSYFKHPISFFKNVFVIEVELYSFSKTIFSFIPMLLLFLDPFLWSHSQVGSLFYFEDGCYKLVCLFASVCVYPIEFICVGCMYTISRLITLHWTTSKDNLP